MGITRHGEGILVLGKPNLLVFEYNETLAFTYGNGKYISTLCGLRWIYTLSWSPSCRSACKERINCPCYYHVLMSILVLFLRDSIVETCLKSDMNSRLRWFEWKETYISRVTWVNKKRKMDQPSRINSFCQ